MMVPFADMFNY